MPFHKIRVCVCVWWIFMMPFNFDFEIKFLCEFNDFQWNTCAFDILAHCVVFSVCCAVCAHHIASHVCVNSSWFERIYSASHSIKRIFRLFVYMCVFVCNVCCAWNFLHFFHVLTVVRLNIYKTHTHFVVVDIMMKHGGFNSITLFLFQHVTECTDFTYANK